MGNSLQPSEARSAYLNGKSAEVKADILERTLRQGPGPQDADWVVAKAADDGAKVIAQAVDDGVKRIEAAAPMTEKSLESFAERLERVEQGVDNLGKQPAAVPAIPSELTTQLERIEALVRRGANVATEPIVSQPVRYLFAFAGGVLMCLALAVLAINERIAPSFVTLTAAFALGLLPAVGYSYLAPIVRDLRR
jgi:hypothetical protein